MATAECQLPSGSVRGVVVVVALAIGSLTLTSTAFAQPAPPALTDTVNDFASLIDPASRGELDKRIRALKA